MSKYSQDPLGYYEILGVNNLANQREIKINYRDRAKEWHPDYNKDKEAIVNFQKLSVAYDTLQNDESRLIYDIFAEAYNSKNYPQMDNLVIIKDQTGAENPFVRVFDLKYVLGKVIKYSVKEEKLVCNQSQALQEALKCSFLNWTLGWWHIKSIAKNIRAIVSNYSKINKNTQENLTLLIHNMVVYYKEGKLDKSYYSAIQALDYADESQKVKLKRFIELLGIKKTAKIPSWRFAKIKLVQLVVPIIMLLIASYPIIQSRALSHYAKKENEITYFQRVTFNSGAETVDDIVVSKIFDIPVDVYDDTKLYHLVSDANIMYGPGSKFDIMTKLSKNHTVRITGFTVDKSWYRVMIDDGQMGFVTSKQIASGIGAEIPFNSKIKAKQKDN